MKTISAALDAHLNQDVTTICSCWVITRRDGTVMGFTDHDADLNYGGILMNSNSGFFRSAITSSTTGSSDNLEVKGFLDSDYIAEDDLINGLYDYAKVEVFMVNWSDLDQGRLMVRTGWFGEVVRWPSGMFVVELKGLLQLFNNQVGHIFQPECRADFGDSRCKVPVIPPVRRSSSLYRIGDRVLVPQPKTADQGGVPFVQVDLPIVNPGFEQVNGSTDSWAMLNAVISNQGVTGHDGAYVLQPNDRSGSATTRVDLTTQLSRVQIDDGKAAITFTAWQFNQEAGWQGGLGLVITGADGTVLATQAPVYAATTTGHWQQISTTMPLPVGAVLATLQIVFRQDPANLPVGAPPTLPAKVLFDDCALTWTHDISSGAYDQDAFPFPSFEIITSVSSDIYGWMFWQDKFVRKTFNSTMGPQNGFGYIAAVAIGSKDGFMSQRVPLPIGVAGITASDIDAGGYAMRFDANVSAETTGMGAYLEVAFVDGSGQFIQNGGIFSAIQTIYTPKIWGSINVIGRVPPGARTAELRMHYVVQGTNIAKASTAYDAVSAFMFSNAISDAGYGIFGGVEYQCVALAANAAGEADPPTVEQLDSIGILGWLAIAAQQAYQRSGDLTAATPPEFSRLVGDTIVDGAVTWKCVDPLYVFVAEVTGDPKNWTFNSNLTNADSFFDWGTVTWLTGKNKGLSMDVRDSYKGSGFVRLMLPMPHYTEVGDQFQIVAGCDKRRETCAARFNNILNFRGEPDLPGTDQYFKIGAPEG